MMLELNGVCLVLLLTPWKEVKLLWGHEHSIVTPLLHCSDPSLVSHFWHLIMSSTICCLCEDARSMGNNFKQDHAVFFLCHKRYPQRMFSDCYSSLNLCHGPFIVFTVKKKTMTKRCQKFLFISKLTAVLSRNRKKDFSQLSSVCYACN